MLLQAFYSIRSERQLMEQLDDSLLLRWFVGLSVDAPVWDARIVGKNRERFLDGDVAQRLLTATLGQPRVQALMSDEHFSVDGTLIQAWASHKSFQPKPPAAPDDKEGGPPGPAGSAEPVPGTGGRNQERDWRGQKRSNETHASVADPAARLARKSNGPASILAYAGHGLRENRNGLVSQVCLTHASGTAQRDAALTLVGRLRHKTQGTRRRITLGADKGYDAQALIAERRCRTLTPHIAADQRVSKTGGRARRASEQDGRRPALGH